MLSVVFMMKINNLRIIKKKDNRTLIDNFNFILHKGDKVAIIGEEGNGKSTLLKAIYNKDLVEEYCNISGVINTNNYKIGYLEQVLSEDIQNEEVMNYFLRVITIMFLVINIDKQKFMRYNIDV